MAIYSLGVRTSNTTSAAAALEIFTRSTADSVRLLEMTLSLVNGTTSIVGVGFPAAIGLGPTLTYGLQEDPPVPGSTVGVALSWTTGPTAPANFYRRATVAGPVGSSWPFTFPRGLVFTYRQSIVLWNLATNDTFDVHLVWDA